MLQPVPNDDDRADWAKRAKAVLRQKQRALRQALPETAARARSARIVEGLLQHPKLSTAKSVALFWPMIERREIDLRPLDAELRVRGVALYYPFMTRTEGGDMLTGFRFAASVEELVVREQRFAEPPATASIAQRGDVDVVVVPALAATLDGQRLGYGSGFYDATLPDLCPPAFSIVVVHDFQLMLELPVESHDFGCGAVVSDRQRP